MTGAGTGPTRRDVEQRLEDLEAEQNTAPDHPPATRAALAALDDATSVADTMLLYDEPAELVRKAAPDDAPADVPEGHVELVETPQYRWFVPPEYVPEEYADALPVGVSEEPILVADFGSAGGVTDRGVLND
jgi:hypothetical protein